MPHAPLIGAYVEMRLNPRTSLCYDLSFAYCCVVQKASLATSAPELLSRSRASLRQLYNIVFLINSLISLREVLLSPPQSGNFERGILH